MTMERILWIVALAAVAYAAWQLRGCREPGVAGRTRTDTTYVDRVVPEVVRDTVVVTRPVERIVYKRTTDTVRVEVPVPTGFEVGGMVGPDPIGITDGAVTLTRWDPRGLRWTQDVYALPRKAWHLWPAIGAQRTAWGVQAGVRVGLRYQRIAGYVGYAFGPDRGAVTFGVHLRPFTLRF